MANMETIDKVKSLIEGHCYAPLKEAAEKWLDEAEKFVDKNDIKLEELSEKIDKAATEFADKADEAAAKLAESELIDKLKEGVATVDEMIEHFGTDEAVQKFGKDLADKIKTHGEELKAAGEKFCDCDACKKAREILEDLGEKFN